VESNLTTLDTCIHTVLDVNPFLPGKKLPDTRAPYAKKACLKRIYNDIWMGSFPALIAGPAKNKNLYYSLYLQTYLQRDVRNLTQVGSVISFF